MVLLGAAQFLGARVCLWIAVAILLGHNLLDPWWPAPDLESGTSSLMAIIFYQGSFIIGPFFVMEVYPLLAWFGVMLLGFGTAFVFTGQPALRNTRLIRIGIAFIVGFAVLRAVWVAMGGGFPGV